MEMGRLRTTSRVRNNSKWVEDKNKINQNISEKYKQRKTVEILLLDFQAHLLFALWSLSVHSTELVQRGTKWVADF